jgi:hypothetical protein
MAADSFLYATMQVDGYTTSRRYAQLLISDTSIQPLAIDRNIAAGKAVIIQTFPMGGADWPLRSQVETCNMTLWEVDAQCVSTPDFHAVLDPNDPMGNPKALEPNDELGELMAGLDQSMRLEAYVSTQRAYLFFNGKPYGCGDLPSGSVPTGKVNVAFGNVLYHSSADDDAVPPWFLQSQYAHMTIRKFDNLGFKSGMSAPQWDETRLPCAPSSEVLHWN